ncbi:hypothetical protein EYM_00145 [Ignicoccus islandicus DSM 13165]|uniref:Uncharacterized protein n=1 Tax=Ignicoccus islandicus DSM 13165 TaxID=940295 RepID=A0A0U3FPG8_9CREN|nr:hypothetical protein [Ignicoccus islandicus]ALU11344.1 hypothetical protein EYM_00145 [Ignicoccus islandicus DSM 13165]
MSEARGECIPSPLVNAIVSAYQIAITKALGAGANAMAQMLLTELGDFLSDYVESVIGEMDYEDVKGAVRKIFQELGLAKEVKIEEKDGKWVIEVRGSVFIPTYKILAQRGIQFFTLSPEALLIASIIRKSLRIKGDQKARVRVNAETPQDEVLRFEVQQISSL